MAIRLASTRSDRRCRRNASWPPGSTSRGPRCARRWPRCAGRTGRDHPRPRRRHRGDAQAAHAVGARRRALAGEAARLAGRAELPADRGAGRPPSSPRVPTSPRTCAASSRRRSRTRPGRASRPAHRQADSRLHLTIAALSGSPRVDRGGDRGAGHAARDAPGDPGPAGEHRALGPPARDRRTRDPGRQADDRARRRWRNTATTPPRCCAAWWAEPFEQENAWEPETTAT